MMASASARGVPTLPLLLLLLSASAALAIRLPEESRSLLATVAPEPLVPAGFWQSIRAVSGNATVTCGLRDFPPIPDGEGESRMLCGGESTTSPAYWVWKATKPSGEPINYGDNFNLRIFNPMLTHCRTVSAGQIKCGVDSILSTNFSVEKVGADATGQPVNFDQDRLYLKSGGKYCQLSGKVNSAFIYCRATTAAAATVFQMPYSHYYSFGLTSLLTNKDCGATFIPITSDLPPVNCNGNNQTVPWNFYSKFVASMMVPGSGLVSGVALAFTAYDQLWHYQVAAWSASTSQVVSVNNDMTGTKIFFTVEKQGAAPGTPLQTGDRVHIKSVKQGKYCGISSATASLLCDASTIGSDGYTFVLKIAKSAVLNRLLMKIQL